MAKKIRLIFGLVLFSICGCGVKSSPLPPEVAPPISKGKPSYFENSENQQRAIPKNIEEEEIVPETPKED